MGQQRQVLKHEAGSALADRQVDAARRIKQHAFAHRNQAGVWPDEASD